MKTKHVTVVKRIIIPVAFMDAIHPLQVAVYQTWDAANDSGQDLSRPPDVPPDFKDMLRSIQACAVRGAGLSFDYDTRTPTGAVRWIVRPELSGDGDPFGRLTQLVPVVALHMRLSGPLEECVRKMSVQIDDTRTDFEEPFNLFATEFTDQQHMVEYAEEPVHDRDRAGGEAQ